MDIYKRPYDKELPVICMDESFKPLIRETHKPGSFYEAFKTSEGKELWDRFELVHTPKHGSWLNVAEIELNVLFHQCLKRRIDQIDKIR